MVSGVRELLARVKLPSDDETLSVIITDLKAGFQALSAPGIHEDFRSDILRVVTASIDLLKTVSAPTYQVDEVLYNLSGIANRTALILNHIANSRPRTLGSGLINTTTGRILPNVFMNENEAQTYVKNMTEMGMMNAAIQVVPVELSSRFIARPREMPVPPAPHPVQAQPMSGGMPSQTLNQPNPSLTSNLPPPTPFDIPEAVKPKPPAFGPLSSIPPAEQGNT